MFHLEREFVIMRNYIACSVFLFLLIFFIGSHISQSQPVAPPGPPGIPPGAPPGAPVGIGTPPSMRINRDNTQTETNEWGEPVMGVQPDEDSYIQFEDTTAQNLANLKPIMETLKKAFAAYIDGATSEQEAVSTELVQILTRGEVSEQQAIERAQDVINKTFIAYTKGTEQERDDAIRHLAMPLTTMAEPSIGREKHLAESFKKAVYAYLNGTLSEEEDTQQDLAELLMDTFLNNIVSLQKLQAQVIKEKREIGVTEEDTGLPILETIRQIEKEEAEKSKKEKKQGVNVTVSFMYANNGFRLMKNKQWDGAIEQYKQAAFLDKKYELVLARTQELVKNINKFGIDIVKSWEINKGTGITYGMYYGW